MNSSDPFQKLFPSLLENSAREVGDLIGETLELQDATCRSGTRQEVFRAPGKRFGVIGFDIKGAQQNSVHLVFELDIAIELGGRLLMLPADEITGRKKQGEIEGELLDAFSEIANIISGVITSSWQNAFPGIKRHFLKGAIQQFAGNTETVDLPPGSLTALSGAIVLEGNPLGRVQFVLPHHLLGEGEPAGEESRAETGAGAHASAEPEEKMPDAGENEQRPVKTPGALENADGVQSQKTVSGQEDDIASEPGGKRIISIIGENPSQFSLLEESVAGESIQFNRLLLNGDLKESLSREIPACVFLLIDKVNEQGLAKTIKVRAALKNECPLIVAGPEWTRTMVLKARKYGATDILITPADGDAIRKKFRKYL